MLALSVQQPWAWAIMAGIKPVENRTWRTSYRGELVIHAGLSVRRDQAGRDHIATLGHVVPEQLTRGVLLGTVELVDCIPSAEALTRFGAAWVDPNPAGWCWIVRKPPLFVEPIVQPGYQRLFSVPLSTDWATLHRPKRTVLNQRVKLLFDALRHGSSSDQHSQFRVDRGGLLGQVRRREKQPFRIGDRTLYT